MWRERAQSFLRAFRSPEFSRGKITLASSALIALALVIASFAYLEFQVPKASADDVQTSVTVLNTPPTWNSGEEGREEIASATTTPTNAGLVIRWIGTATDSSGDNYYMIICKTSAAPTANPSAAPSCNGGISNQWALSGSTVSNVQAVAATTTKDTFPFNNEKNDWWAWVCDANSALPRCYSIPSQGETFGDQGSPFVINHVPVYSAISNDGPEDPGGTVTWTSTSYDNDSLGGTQDQVQLFVCKASGFSTSTGCTGAGGAWATSTLTNTNAATTTSITDPYPDGSYSAFVYLMDNHFLVATSTFQGTNSSFSVNNIAPSLSGGTISVNNGSNIILTVPASTSGPFTVNFTVTDRNSCRLQGGVGNEVSSAITSVYRSGVASTCVDSSNYNANNCYAATSTLFTPHISCTQSGPDVCSGITDPTVDWTCTYSLWYVAEPTESGTTTPWTSDNWLARVQVTDDDASTSPMTESSSGVELLAFLAFNVTETSIGYPSLEPGQNSTTLGPSPTTTDLIALGNVGLDEDLYGSTMCSNFSSLGGPGNPDACDTNGYQTSNDIPATTSQKVATSSVAYGSAQAFFIGASTSPLNLGIHVPKTTTTTTPQERDTHWGIAIPSAITTAGAYTGQNTIIGKTSNFSFW